MAKLIGGLQSLFVLALAAACLSPASAAPPAPVSGVTVTAPRLSSARERVRRFGQPTGRGRLARWMEPVCPFAEGLPAAFDAYVVARIRQAAVAVGAPAGSSGCEANVLIVVTPQPDELARRIASDPRGLLHGVDRWPIDRVQLAGFLGSKSPVRWWYVADNRQAPTAGGEAVRPQVFVAANASTGHGAMFGPPQVDAATPSRLVAATDEAFSRAVIVVDAKRVAGLTAGQLADYLAMVSLAEVRPDAARFEADTVMRLFDVGVDAAPAGLTRWDRSYLASLYADTSALSGGLQRQAMAGRLGRNVAGNPSSPATP